MQLKHSKTNKADSALNLRTKLVGHTSWKREKEYGSWLMFYHKSRILSVDVHLT